MKKLRVFILALLIIPCLLFTGCSLFNGETAYVTGIEKTEDIGDSAVYTITYSDGSTSNFTVENGEDGEDVKLEEIFSACVTRGLYTNDNDGFKSFLADYLQLEVDDTKETEGINKALMSSVEVYSHFKINPVWNGSSSYQLGCGAGVIYKINDEYSYVITNYHVVYDDDCQTSNGISNEIALYQYGADVSIGKNSITGAYELGGDKVECTYIGGTLEYDIAILRVDTNKLKEVNPSVRAVDVADGYSVGDTAIAIGNPNGAGISVTKGIVSVLSEEIPLTISDYIGERIYRVMRVDCAINGGNSGGGIYNEKGELIGILNSKSVYDQSGDQLEGMAHALPYDNITKVADNIIYYYEDENPTTNGVNKLSLGIQYEVNNSRVVYNSIDNTISLRDDLVIKSISSNLAKGFNIGDIVTHISINGEKYTIERAYQLTNYLLMVRAGDDLIFTVTRNDVPNVTITITDVAYSNFIKVS